MSLREITVPDLGDFSDVPVIDILVQAGDKVDVESPLVTLESDKATMDVPSPIAGKVEKVLVAVGDTVSTGSAIIALQTSGGEDSLADEVAEVAAVLDDEAADVAAGAAQEQQIPGEQRSAVTERPVTTVLDVKIPDIGDFKDVPIIEVMVTPGDVIDAEDPLVTLESDKATMDVPSPAAGKVLEVLVEKGDTVSEGHLILRLSQHVEAIITGAAQDQETVVMEQEQETDTTTVSGAAESQPAFLGHEPPASLPPPPVERAGVGRPHASPGIRRFARELGVELTEVRGSGAKGRILREDVQSWVKGRLSQAGAAGAGGGPALPEMPEIDFSQFGDIETKPLNKIKRLTAINLHRSWLHVPHVTHHDEADITELEEFRRQMKDDAAAEGIRLTPLAFVLKGCVAALKRYPTFNASLEKGGENLILKNYYHIGVAVDTADGLVVPVVRDADKKGVLTIAKELGELSERARNKKMSPLDIQGASFTISSLGGIGGTAFTPIVNAPEVAILGVTRSQHKPIYQDGQFVPRLMLPLSLSYDHRVVDGAEAARFVAYLTQVLSDVRRLLL